MNRVKNYFHYLISVLQAPPRSDLRLTGYKVRLTTYEQFTSSQRLTCRLGDNWKIPQYSKEIRRLYQILVTLCISPLENITRHNHILLLNINVNEQQRAFPSCRCVHCKQKSPSSTSRWNRDRGCPWGHGQHSGSFNWQVLKLKALYCQCTDAVLTANIFFFNFSNLFGAEAMTWKCKSN